jgi:hypothetical protein
MARGWLLPARGRHFPAGSATGPTCFLQGPDQVTTLRPASTATRSAGGAACGRGNGELAGLSGMIRGPVPARPLSPRCGLSGDALTTAKAVAPRSPSKGRCRSVEAKTRKDWDEGTKGPSPRRGCLRGFVQRVARAAAPPVSRGDASPTWTINPATRPSRDAG